MLMSRYLFSCRTPNPGDYLPTAGQGVAWHGRGRTARGSRRGIRAHDPSRHQDMTVERLEVLHYPEAGDVEVAALR